MNWHDLRIALRGFVRVPGFALGSILTLTFAVGMATSIFSVVDALLLRPLPYKQSARLAAIWTRFHKGERGPSSFDDFEDWIRHSKTIESGATYSSYYHPILSQSSTQTGHAERLSALFVSHGYFDVLAVTPALGRFFRPEEDRDGHDYVVVLASSFWRTHFHSDPGVIGRSIMLNAHPHTILGVAGPDLFPLPASLDPVAPEIYRPVGEPFDSGARDGRHLETLVRLRPDATIEQAQAELNVRCRAMQRAHPREDDHLGARILSLNADLTRNVRAPLLGLQAAVLVLMLIACANIANLLLVKSTGRTREFAIRAALGAGTARLAGMLLSESLVLASAGCAGGLIVALWSTAALSSQAAQVLPDAASIAVDWRVLVFSIALSFAASVLFGIAPLFRLHSTKPADALRSGTRVSGDRRQTARQILAAAQIALALVLVVAAGLLVKSFLRLRSVSPGFDPRNVLAASVSLPEERYPNDSAVTRFFDDALNKVRSLPGVRQAAVVNVVPMSGDFDTTWYNIEGQPAPPLSVQGPDRYVVTPDYFQTLRIPLVEGRLFDMRDDAAHPDVCVINETAARAWFHGQSPLGHRIRAGAISGNWQHSPFRQVVGVVADIAQYGLGLPHTAQIYMPHAQFAAHYMTFLIRADRRANGIAAAARNTVFSIDPEQPVYDVKPLETIVSNTIAARRLGLSVLLAFALAALLLATVGIYGVVSYSVAQRTSEFGIRLALGALPAAIFRSAIRDSLPMILAGLAVGIAASFAISNLLVRFLFEIKATDAAVFACVPLLLGAVALAACYVPARRAAGVDPLVALRDE